MRLSRLQVGSLILVLVVSLSLNVWLYIQLESESSVYTVKLDWKRENIAADRTISGFVCEWTPDRTIKVMQIAAWMGNPYGVLWEGDIHVTLNNSDPELKSKLLMQYQFDSHAGSPIPHQRSGDLRPGCLVNEGETIYVHRLFHNFDDEDTVSGDGWIIIYYTFAS